MTPSATSAPSVCDGPNHFTSPTYTIGAVTGVQYTVGGVPTAPGTYDATNGTSVHIEATVTDPKYEIVGTSVWDFSFTEPTPACTVKVVPVKPVLTQAACTGPGQHDLAYYTVTAVTGVLYYVKVDGGAEQPLAPGKYVIQDGTSTVQVIAKGDADNYYVIEGGPIVYDVDTLAPAGQCLTLLIPLEPDPVNDACDALAPGVVPATTYTLFYVEHIIYSVSVNDGAPQDVILTKNDDVRRGPSRCADPRHSARRRPDEVHDGRLGLDDGLLRLRRLQDQADPGRAARDRPVLRGRRAPRTGRQASLTIMAAKVQHQGTITIPATPVGVQYFLDGVPEPAGCTRSHPVCMR